MSAGYWLDGVPDEDDCPVCAQTPEQEMARIYPMRAAHRIGTHSWNLTYNLGPMVRAAGLGHWRDLVGKPAPEAADVIAPVLAALTADPARFEAMNPPNGWGTYRGLVDILTAMEASCRAHKGATVGAWL